jgi:serine/threonine protein kinase/TolB-like protein/tetratricopeptide (TPR) repeat protein
MALPGSSGRPFTVTTGARLGAYEILSPLGAGGMGEVYRARDTRLGREVALKLIPACHVADPAARRRFMREARIVASLNHPNVLALHDIGSADETIFIVTELVEGEPLRGLALPLRKRLALAAQVADGLAAAHAAGITHRDLKPDNVMVTRDGRVKLLDFGIASRPPLVSDSEATVSVEENGLVMGTLGYMAPEQLRSGTVDYRADIFSFGALLYELLTGSRAFQGDSAADVIAAVLHADSPELPPAVPPDVRAIVRRCLEKNPEERFQSARDLGFALRQAGGTNEAPEAVDPPRAETPSPSAIRRHLESLLSSPPIAGAARLAALLRFIVEETLSGRGAQLKELRIGLDVFGRRTDSYDPAFDPIVRVQMGRLRAKLRAYYTGRGLSESVRIDIPVGSYVPVFTGTVAAPRGESAQALDTRSDDPRIAVLPIVNMSADAENQYFCDGLTEELINHLAQVAGLRVVARTSSFQFKEPARDIREIGRLLDVGKVLEGSVRKSGSRIRVTVQLINVTDGCHVWSERYEGSLNDVFAIHEQISRSVQRSLQLHVLGTEGDTAATTRTHPRQMDAYNLYLQGRFHWKKRTEDGLRTALDNFERAARLDAGFARARAGIADCQFMLGMSGAEAPQLCMPRAAGAARQALDLDRTLAEAHASLAGVRNCFEWDLHAAEEGYRRAIDLDPSYATALHWRGFFLEATRGQLTEAARSLDQAIDLDPMSPSIVADLGLVCAFREDFDRAAMYCRRALSVQPDFHRSYWFLGLVGAWTGNFQTAEEALERGLELCPGAAFRSRLLGALGFVYGQSGKRERATHVKREFERLRETSYVSAFELAQIEMGLGNHAGALACLEHAVVHRDSFAILLRTWNTFTPLRQDPRFLALLAQIGLESHGRLLP